MNEFNIDNWYFTQPRVLGTFNSRETIENAPDDLKDPDGRRYMRGQARTLQQAADMVGKIASDLEVLKPQLFPDLRYDTSSDPLQRRMFKEVEFAGVLWTIGQLFVMMSLTGVDVSGKWSSPGPGRLLFTPVAVEVHPVPQGFEPPRPGFHYERSGLMGDAILVADKIVAAPRFNEAQKAFIRAGVESLLNA